MAEGTRRRQPVGVSRRPAVRPMGCCGHHSSSPTGRRRKASCTPHTRRLQCEGACRRSVRRAGKCNRCVGDQPAVVLTPPTPPTLSRAAEPGRSQQGTESARVVSDSAQPHHHHVDDRQPRRLHERPPLPPPPFTQTWKNKGTVAAPRQRSPTSSPPSPSQACVAVDTPSGPARSPADGG